MRRDLALLFLAAPALARACPVCARDNSPWAAALIAGMIAVPYVVGAVVFRAVRRSGSQP